jgi:hypothetical protein
MIRKPIPIPEPERIGAYLTNHGWTGEFPLPSDGCMFTFRDLSDDGNPITVFVPGSSSVIFYPLRVNDVVVTVAVIEERSEEAVWNDILAGTGKTTHVNKLLERPQTGVCIRIAGNTEIPSLLALRAKGYRVWLEYAKVNDPRNPWYPYMPDYQAENEMAYFSATSPVELLGLVAMWETRGDDWKFKKTEPNILNELMASAKSFDSDGSELSGE